MLVDPKLVEGSIVSLHKKTGRSVHFNCFYGLKHPELAQFASLRFASLRFASLYSTLLVLDEFTYYRLFHNK